MNDQHYSRVAAESDGLALKCLAHLEKEEAMLDQAVQALRQVRTALVQGDAGQLSQALQQQQHTTQAADDLRAARGRLRQSVARVLGIAANEATLGALADRVSGEMRNRLLGYRVRLTQMARELEMMNRGNAALIQQSMHLLQRLLAQLTGNENATDRYAPSGQRELGGGGSMFQTRC
jgi:hypothetical protein